MDPLAAAVEIPGLMPRLERMLGRPVTAWRIVSGGYTPALRLVCSTSRDSVFVKIGVTPDTAIWVRREAVFYERVHGTFRAAFHGFDDHPERPFIVLEDLSTAVWPPPWSASAVGSVLKMIDAVHRADVSDQPWLPTIGEWPSGWAEVAASPDAFLALGLVGREWLERALPRLLGAAERCDVTGRTLCHLDIRSDNLCLAGERAILVDWNCACIANPRFDLGFWLPSLAAEGGPLPETILPDAPEVAASVSGFFAARAGLPLLPEAPRVRIVQLQQLRTALPWAARALGLPMPTTLR
jgi:hypothetical protein